MPESLRALVPGSELDATINAYRTCELVTVGKDGTPLAWPTSGISLADGTFLLTTSLGFPQKAYNIRRDERVALLFSEPHASGLERPGQILVQGTAICPDRVHTVPEGDLAAFWRRLFERQPNCRKYLDRPATALTDFYFMRLLITVTPAAVTARDLPAATGTLPVAGSGLIGEQVLASYPSTVLAARDAAGAPTLLRTTVSADGGAYRVAVPDGHPVADGRASLLVHRHDAQLWNLHSAVVTGTLKSDADGGRLLTPDRLIEPAGGAKPSLTDPIRTVRDCRATTKKYLAKRGLPRPRIPWKAYRELRDSL
ncbi:pyridoxamine 5'-phosphate oxidase family protein [Paractinoplanes toevensis]|uniref:Pyridoxamine 5'-phosphate oxidase N-terminal domain-containing protein n=1 Tax=Paractinoplanes toevensis TaxID=571911 RepID=A0A919TG40_9ACTN|nr:pyridoxamine 5'-phosphate oxidase family protein [Actinoplanes toevensis]GIM93775.1 hypothetical protein Ato02nite_055680 [Actinoplanes toevensis]